MVSLFSASTIDEGAFIYNDRADSFYYNADEDHSDSFDQWQSSCFGASMGSGEYEVVYERVFEPHPSKLAAGSKPSPKVFFSRRPDCTSSSPAAAIAAQWRASQGSSVAFSTPSSSHTSTPLSTPRTRSSIFSEHSTATNSSKLSVASDLVASAIARVFTLGRSRSRT